MTTAQHLRLPHTLYLPMNPDGSLTEPTELRISVQRLREHEGEPKPYCLLTVHPHMEHPHLVTLYSEYVPSRRIPADVQAMVDAFNSDIAQGWKALLASHHMEQADRVVDDIAALDVKLRAAVGEMQSTAGADGVTRLLAHAESFSVDR